MKFTPLLVSYLLAGANAASVPALHEKRHTLSAKWQKGDRLDPNQEIEVRVALKQQNLDKGMEYLIDV